MSRRDAERLSLGGMWERPAVVDVWRAVEAYLVAAYGVAPPPAVAERLARLRAAPEETFYECEAFERGDDRFALRLGNPFYPHMKLVVEAAPDGRALFRVDTHDRHFLELVDASDPSFVELMTRNAEIARAVEAAWSACGLLTRSEHLREAMARWRAERP